MNYYCGLCLTSGLGCDEFTNLTMRNIKSRSESFWASPSCRPQLRFGFQSLGLAQKDLLLLVMI
jgi:hypothetical protein